MERLGGGKERVKKERMKRLGEGKERVKKERTWLLMEGKHRSLDRGEYLCLMSPLTWVVKNGTWRSPFGSTTISP